MVRTTKRRGRVWRYFKRTVITLFVLIVLLIGTTLIAIHTAWGRDKIRGEIESVLVEQFPGGAHVRSVEGSVLGTLVVNGIEIDGNDHAPMVTVDKLSVDVGLWSLIRKHVDVKSLLVDGVHVRIRPQPPAPPKPIEPPSPDDGSGPSWRVSLADVQITHVDVGISGNGAQPVDIDDVAVSAKAEIAGSQISASLAVVGAYREKQLPFALATQGFQLDGTKIVLHDLAAIAGGIAVVGNELSIDPAGSDTRPAGALIAIAPATSVARLANVVLPGDAMLSVSTVRDPANAALVDLALEGSVGHARLLGWAHADLGTRAVGGLLAADVPNLAVVTDGALVGSGTTVIAAASDGTSSVRGIVFASESLANAPTANALFAIDATQGIAALVQAAAAGSGFGSGSGSGSAAAAKPTLIAKATGAAAVKASVATMKANVRSKMAQVMASPATARIAGVVDGLGFRVTAVVDLARSAGAIAIAKADTTIAIDDPVAASNGRVDAKGTVRATASIVDGKLFPALDVRVGGRLSGARLALGDTRLASLDGNYTAHVVGGGGTPLGQVHLSAFGIAQGTSQFGSATVDVSNRADNTIDVVAHAQPKPGTKVDLDAHVNPLAPGGAIAIDLGHHHVLLPDGRELAGDGGRVMITPAKITVDKLVTVHRGGKVEVLGASVDRATGAIAGEVDVRTLPVALIDERAQGNATGHIKIARSGAGAWKGDVHLSAANIVIGDRLTLDSTIDAAVDGRRVSLKVGTTLDPTTTTATSDSLLYGLRLGALHGSAEVAITVDGPRDLTDASGWFKLTRKDIQVASVTLGSLDLGIVGATGVVDGTVLFTPVDTHGSLQVSGVKTPVGKVDATATFDNEPGGLLTSTAATLAGIGAAHIDAHVALPEHVFDPVAWAALGKNVVRGVDASIDELAVDPALFAKFGKDLPYRGKARVAVAIGEGLSSATVTAIGSQFSGGPLVKPVDLRATTVVDGTHTGVELDVFAAGAGARMDGDRSGLLVHAQGQSPISLDGLIANAPAWILGKPPDVAVTGALTIAKTNVAQLLALVGRTKDIAKGTIEGTGSLGGTLANPTAAFDLAARDVEVPQLVTGKKAPILKQLAIKASWTIAAAQVAIDGLESDGGELHISATGRPDQLSRATGKIVIKKFDLAPLAAFAPGALVSATGIVAADVAIASFDPAQMRITGDLSLEKGRIPIATMVGTIRNTAAKLHLDGRRGTLAVTGQLGPCLDAARTVCRTVRLDANGDTDKIVAKLVLFHIQPITNTQPDISATVDAKLTRETDDWHADVAVSKAAIVLPNTQGNELLAASAPSDMVFLDALSPLVRGGVKAAPERPFLIADVTIDSTPITAEEVRGSVKGQLQLSIGGDAIGMLGIVEAEQAVVDIFNHRYQLDHGFVTFDGTTDAQLDLRLIHDFPSVTLIADVGGRISDPKLSLASEPGSYQEGQLLGFFLGGEPGGDPNQETRDAAQAAGTSLVSAKLSHAANRVLPKAARIDLLNCSVATATTTGACTVGKWIGTKLFLAYKQHLEAPLNENQYDGQVEYYLRHDIVLEGNVGDRQYDGLDLLWRHRW